MLKRRSTDRHSGKASRWDFSFLAGSASLRVVTWEEQRSQFLTRYLFWALGLVYFNLGSNVTRSDEFLLLVHVMQVVYVVLTTIYFVHARRNTLSPMRCRLAMWTDLIGVAIAALADASMTSAAYLVFLAIILGNGMRYGLRPFGEAALGSFLMVLLVVYLRYTDYLSARSIAGIFFMLFGAIVVLYSYSLMARIERRHDRTAAQSGVDQLSGLLNRRGLEERALVLFEDVRKNARPLSVLFADLDGFKGINDTLGHHGGDVVLRDVAGLIGTTIRAQDVAARYGGDEFVIIMPDARLPQALLVAERLQAAVALWARQGEVSLSLSIGMGEAPIHGQELDSLLKRVDGAMYLCKQSYGRGGIRAVEDMA